VNVKSFFVSALSSALDLGIATCDDVVKHVTPEVLATHLPRPLWARLLTACLGAPRVDSQLVVETIGVPNLCEHVPTPIIWACIAEIAARSLGGGVVAAVATTPASRPIVTRAGSQPIPTATAKPLSQLTPPGGTLKPVPLSTPPPPDKKPVAAPPAPPAAVGPNIPAPANAPLTNLLEDLEAEDKDGKPARARTPTSQRFRQTNTNIGRLAAANQRRPQAQATAPTPEPAQSAPVRRGATEGDFEIETDVSAGKDDWKNALAVEDEQLVDWSSSEETMTATTDGRDDRFGRKR
jgi:hypothetical protein